jgi:hypothetical protein
VVRGAQCAVIKKRSDAGQAEITVTAGTPSITLTFESRYVALYEQDGVLLASPRDVARAAFARLYSIHVTLEQKLVVFEIISNRGVEIFC